MIVKRGAWVLAMLAVTVLALLPVEHLQLPVFDWWDKAQHTLAFTVLTAWALWLWPMFVPRVLLGMLAYGAGLELAQWAGVLPSGPIWRPMRWGWAWLGGVLPGGGGVCDALRGMDPGSSPGVTERGMDPGSSPGVTERGMDPGSSPGMTFSEWGQIPIYL